MLKSCFPEVSGHRLLMGSRDWLFPSLMHVQILTYFLSFTVINLLYLTCWLFSILLSPLSHWQRERVVEWFGGHLAPSQGQPTTDSWKRKGLTILNMCEKICNATHTKFHKHLAQVILHKCTFLHVILQTFFSVSNFWAHPKQWTTAQHFKLGSLFEFLNKITLICIDSALSSPKTLTGSASVWLSSSLYFGN